MFIDVRANIPRMIEVTKNYVFDDDERNLHGSEPSTM